MSYYLVVVVVYLYHFSCSKRRNDSHIKCIMLDQPFVSTCNNNSWSPALCESFVILNYKRATLETNIVIALI